MSTWSGKFISRFYLLTSLTANCGTNYDTFSDMNILYIRCLFRSSQKESKAKKVEEVHKASEGGDL